MLKIGVLGVGQLGKIHLRLLKELSQFELIGFYDPSKDAEVDTIAEFGIKAFASAEDLINSCDALDIVTPTLVHYELAKQAIKKSKHIFIERPLTNTISEAKSLLQLVREANIKIQVGHVERFNPAFIAAKNHIKDPMIIESRRLTQYNPVGTDISVVFDLMLHDIDIVLCLVKANIRRISANGVAVIGPTPDIVNARIEFDNGAVANLTTSRISEINLSQSRFFKRETDITIDFLNKSVDHNKFSPHHVLANTFENPIIVQNTNALKMELESFANSIINDERPVISIEDGYKAMEVANKITEQIRLNANFAATNTIFA